MKRMCLSQANADLAEAAEKLEAIRKKLAVSVFKTSSLSHSFFPCTEVFRLQNNGNPFLWSDTTSQPLRSTFSSSHSRHTEIICLAALFACFIAVVIV